MKTQLSLSKPPITEAIIDIQVSFDGEVALAQLDLADKIPAAFTEVKPILRHSGEIKFDTKNPEAQQIAGETSQFGYRYSGGANPFVLQSTRKGLTISRLKPYSSWNDLVSTAQAMWKIYVEKASPVSTSRIGVRYINSLSIPLPVGNLNEWLKNPPVMPAVNGFEINGFFHRTFGSDGSNNFILTLAQEPAIHEHKLPILLDIDLYKLQICDLDDPEIWDVINQFRDLKNGVFSQSVTEKTLDLYR